MINQGKHRAKVKDWALGVAGTGTKQIGAEFDLLDRPGETIAWYGYFTDKAFESTIKALRSMGWQGSDLSELDGHGGGLDANEVTLVVEQEDATNEDGSEQVDDQGAPVVYAKVRWVNSAGGVAMKNQLVGDDLKAFGALMRGKILALDPSSAAKRAAAGVPKAAQRTAAEPPSRLNDPDIPF